MGIRVECPNGHKLNIKATLAGKRGICPRCGAKFKIPATLETNEENGSEVDAAVTPEVEMAEGPAEESISVAVDAPASESLQAPPIPTAAVDPLAEAPDAVWYVRPPTGGQFGPAKADVMRAWLAEGRITGDSHIWREGWDDWALASEAFVELAASAEANRVVVRVPGESAETPKKPESGIAPVISVAMDTKAGPGVAQRQKKRANSLVLGLVAVVVILGIVLVCIVVSRS